MGSIIDIGAIGAKSKVMKKLPQLSEIFLYYSRSSELDNYVLQYESNNNYNYRKGSESHTLYDPCLYNLIIKVAEGYLKNMNQLDKSIMEVYVQHIYPKIYKKNKEGSNINIESYIEGIFESIVEDINFL